MLATEFRLDLMLHLYPEAVSALPNDQSYFIKGSSTNDGVVEVWLQPGPRFLIRVRPPASLPYSFNTRNLVFSNEHAFELAIFCDHEKAMAWVNGQLAGCWAYKFADDSPLEVTLPEWADTDLTDFCRFVEAGSKVSREASVRRANALVAKPGRRKLTEGEMLDALRAECEQISQLIALINSGLHAHWIGLSARIRSVVCHSKQDKLPLLQHCAALRDLPLLVYAPAPHWANYDRDDGIELGLRVFPVRTISSHIEMDLDFSLQAPFSRHEGRAYTNNDMLKMTADTLGGAHHDKSIEPMADALKDNDVRSFGSNIAMDGISACLVEVGTTVSALGSQVLESFGDQTLTVAQER